MVGTTGLGEQSGAEYILCSNPVTKKRLPLSIVFQMVGTTGFEPATPTTPRWCATKLRYVPILFYSLFNDSQLGSSLLRKMRYQTSPQKIINLSHRQSATSRCYARRYCYNYVNITKYKCNKIRLLNYTVLIFLLLLPIQFYVIIVTDFI